MVDYYSLTSSVVIYGILPLAAILPVVSIIISFRQSCSQDFQGRSGLKSLADFIELKSVSVVK